MPRFELKGKVQLDGSQWQAGLNQAKRSADKWSSETAGMIRRRLVSAFAIGALLRSTTALLDKATEIRDKSARIGVDPEMFQHLDYAARQSGASIDDVSTAMRTLARMQQDASEGSKEALQAFERMGLVFDDIAGRSVEDIFMDIGKAVEEGKNQANLLADMQTLLGRGGQSLIPVFQSNFSEMLNESKAIGAPLSADQVTEFGKTADNLTKAEQQVWAKVGKGLIKGVEYLGRMNRLGESLGNMEGGRHVVFDQDYMNSVKNAAKLEEHLREIRRNTESLK